jgi:hypothetical protein
MRTFFELESLVSRDRKSRTVCAYTSKNVQGAYGPVGGGIREDGERASREPPDLFFESLKFPDLSRKIYKSTNFAFQTPLPQHFKHSPGDHRCCRTRKPKHIWRALCAPTANTIGLDRPQPAELVRLLFAVKRAWHSHRAGNSHCATC